MPIFVGEGTIDVIVKAIEDYTLDEFEAEGYDPQNSCLMGITNLNQRRDDIGRALLAANYESIIARYDARYDKVEVPGEYTYHEPEEYDDEDTLEFIDWFVYQSGEGENWENSTLAHSLDILKTRIFEHRIETGEYILPWGVN